MSADKRIACGVVTYNPDPARLEENLRAIAGQVGRVRIFDNGSEDRADWAEQAVQWGADRVVPSSENLGMAKALNRLAADARADGYEAVLFLDQDSVAAADLVERLQEAALSLDEEGVTWGLLGATMRNRGTGHEAGIPTESLALAKRVITSGSLVSLDAWAQVGGYDERLFLDWVDFEFCDALRQAGRPVLQVRDAELLHELGDPMVAFTLPIVPPGREDGVFYAANRPYFRWRDRFRSMAVTIDTYRGTPIEREERATRRSTALRALLVEPNRWDVLRGIVAGTREGRAAAKGSRRG